jgi:hypothetical protein
MKFPADTIERFKELGYTELEARFLYVIAVHSGYFTLAQFRKFTNTNFRSQSTSFARRIVKRGHATVRDYMNRGSIFHLFSKVIYSHLEEFISPHRCNHSFDFMRARLLVVDFILSNQDLDYFETQQDKIKFFCEDLGVPRNCLPTKVYPGQKYARPLVRYFVDKFPMFLWAPFLGASPLVTFSYVDSGSQTHSRFSEHLAAYRQLFQELKSFRFLYIASKDAYFHRAADRFRKGIEPPRESLEPNDILRYFQIREKWERHDYVVPVVEDFEFLNRARKHFDGERVENLYRLWTARQVSDTALCLEFPQRKPDPGLPALFDTFLVKQNGAPLDESFRGDERPTRSRLQ